MSRYTQHYQPQHQRHLVAVWIVIMAILVTLMLAIGGEGEDAKRTAEQKLSAALDDAYQSGVRDAQRGCRK